MDSRMNSVEDSGKEQNDLWAIGIEESLTVEFEIRLFRE